MTKKKNKGRDNNKYNKKHAEPPPDEPFELYIVDDPNKDVEIRGCLLEKIDFGFDHYTATTDVNVVDDYVYPRSTLEIYTEEQCTVCIQENMMQKEEEANKLKAPSTADDLFNEPPPRFHLGKFARKMLSEYKKDHPNTMEEYVDIYMDVEADKNIENITNTEYSENSQPVEYEDSQPADYEDSQPMDYEDSYPIENEDSHPIENEDSHTIENEYSQPIENEDSQPIENEPNNIIENKSSKAKKNQRRKARKREMNKSETKSKDESKNKAEDESKNEAEDESKNEAEDNSIDTVVIGVPAEVKPEIDPAVRPKIKSNRPRKNRSKNKSKKQVEEKVEEQSTEPAAKQDNEYIVEQIEVGSEGRIPTPVIIRGPKSTVEQFLANLEEYKEQCEGQDKLKEFSENIKAQSLLRTMKEDKNKYPLLKQFVHDTSICVVYEFGLKDAINNIWHFAYKDIPQNVIANISFKDVEFQPTYNFALVKDHIVSNMSVKVLQTKLDIEDDELKKDGLDKKIDQMTKVTSMAHARYIIDEVVDTALLRMRKTDIVHQKATENIYRKYISETPGGPSTPNSVYRSIPASYNMMILTTLLDFIYIIENSVTHDNFNHFVKKFFHDLGSIDEEFILPGFNDFVNNIMEAYSSAFTEVYCVYNIKEEKADLLYCITMAGLFGSFLQEFSTILTYILESVYKKNTMKMDNMYRRVYSTITGKIHNLAKRISVHINASVIKKKTV